MRLECGSGMEDLKILRNDSKVEFFPNGHLLCRADNENNFFFVERCGPGSRSIMFQHILCVKPC